MSIQYGSVSGQGGGSASIPVTNGAPTTGTWTAGQIAIDPTNQAIWICTVSGSPGTWVSNGVSSIQAGTNVSIGGTAQVPVINAAEEALLVPTVSGGWVAETTSREGTANTTATPLVSGETYFVALTLPAMTVTKLGVMSGNTAVVTPAHQWFCLYDANGNALCATSDDTSNAWALNTFKSLNINFTYAGGAWSGVQGTPKTLVIPAGLYYFGVMVSAATPNNFVSKTTPANVSGLAPAIAFLDNAHVGLTTPNTAPSPVNTTLGNPGGLFYGVVG